MDSEKKANLDGGINMSIVNGGRVLNCNGDGRTKQSFRDRVNINTIIAKHRRTGMIEHLNAKAPFYGDVSEFVDYQTCMEKVKRANELFMLMSPEVRDKFENDPQQMISFLSDEKNMDEAVRLGMVKAKPPVEVAPVVPPVKP